MRAAKTITLVLLVLALLLFAAGNWQPVELNIGWGLIVETRLPLLVIGAFLLGLLPAWVIHRLALRRLERRMDGTAGVATAPDGDGFSADPRATGPGW